MIDKEASTRRAGRPRNAASREQFLDAAVALFGEQGIANTTIAHIAKHVGVTSAMVHYHFASRELLLDAIASERILPFVQEVWAPVTSSALTNPQQVVVAIGRALLQGVQVRPWATSLWLNDIASPSGELCQRVMQHLPVDKIEALTSAIAAAQARGEINRLLQPHMIFPSIVGLILLPLASTPQCAQLHEGADHSFAALSQHVEAALLAAMRPL